MGTFDNLYLNQLKKLQEENKRLKSLLEADGPESQFEWDWGESGASSLTPKQLERMAAEREEWVAKRREEKRQALLKAGLDVHDPKYNLGKMAIDILLNP